MRITSFIVALAACAVLAAPAWADWSPGDPFTKWQQLPDPNGWDVDVVTDTVYDDFLCNETGPISDIHFWASWEGDNVGQITQIDISLHGDVPAGTDPNVSWSHPDSVMFGDPLWFQSFLPGQFIEASGGSGPQGWLVPNSTPLQWNDPDHFQYFQINIPQIEDPFIQTEGTIYWLGIHIHVANAATQVGWKTSVDHWNDDAAYYYGGWNELIDPIEGTSLDMAFVLTIPEPATLMLLSVGVLGVVSVSRPQRR